MPRTRLHRRLALGAGSLVGLGLAFVAVVGFAHTQMGRPLLRYMPGMGAPCPVGGDLDAATRERARAGLLDGVAGEYPAASQEVYAFELGRTARTDVVAWADRSEVECERGRHASHLRCSDVAADDLGTPFEARSITFVFDPQGQLASTDATHELTSAAGAEALASQRAGALAQRLGPASGSRGELAARHLEAGPLTRASVDFRFANRRSVVAATNLGRGRFSVRETHQRIGAATAPAE